MKPRGTCPGAGESPFVTCTWPRWLWVLGLGGLFLLGGPEAGLWAVSPPLEAVEGTLQGMEGTQRVPEPTPKPSLRRPGPLPPPLPGTLRGGPSRPAPRPSPVPATQPGSAPPQKPGVSATPSSTSPRPAPQKSVQSSEARMVTLDFNQVDLRTVVKFISELTGKNFVLDEKVQGKVTVISPSRISVEEAYQVFLTVLDLKGFAAIEEGPVIKIVPAREARQQNVPVVPPQAPEPEEENFLIRVVPLEYIPATDTAKLLTPLLTKNGNLIPYPEGNLMILADSARNVEKLLTLIRELDKKPPEGKGGIHVYYLQHANAEDVAKVLSNLVSRAPRGPSRGRPTPSRTPVAHFEGGISITADKATNSLIILAGPEDYARLKEIIRKLDIQRRQVYVEAAILEMSLDKTRELGVEFRTATTLEQSLEQGRSAVVAGTLLGTEGISRATTNPLEVTGLAVGVIRGTVEFGGQTYANVGALIRALTQESDVNILSTPNILTLDNQEAKIVVGENVPFITGTSQTVGGNVQVTIERKDVGIVLRITPHTTESDMVRLDLFQEISSVSREIQVGPDQKTPVTSKRSAETSVMVRDRETVVIGGLISDDVIVTEQKVPLLGDIPLLGYLFRYQKKQKVKRNLLIFLTPYIVRDAKTLAELTEKNRARLERFRRSLGFEEKRGFFLNEPAPDLEGPPQAPEGKP